MVGGQVDALGAGGLEALEHMGHASPIVAAGGFQVPDVDGNGGFAGDAYDFVERGINAVLLGTLVGEVNAAVLGGHFGKRDNFLGGEINVRHVLEGGGDAEGALLHGAGDFLLHGGHFLRCGGTVLFANDEIAQAAQADAGGQIDGGRGFLEIGEVFGEVGPRRREAVAFPGVGAVGEHAGIERSDGRAFARDFGGDALRDLGGGAAVDEGVVFGLAEQIDEAGREHQAGAVDAAARAALALLGKFSDGVDAVAADGHIRLERGSACAIDDKSVFEYEVVRRLRARDQHGAKERRRGKQEFFHAPTLKPATRTSSLERQRASAVAYLVSAAARLASQSRLWVSPSRVNSILPVILSPAILPENLFVFEVPFRSRTMAKEMASSLTVPSAMVVSTGAPPRPGAESLPVSFADSTFKVSVLVRSGPPLRPGVVQIQVPVGSGLASSA